MSNSRIKNVEKRLLSDNWGTLKLINVDYKKNDGSWINQKREVYENGDGSAMLLYNLKSKKIILTKQLRLPAYMNGHSEALLVEVCAGLLDDDTPEVCALREAEEETGYRVENPVKVFEAFMSPGAVTEKLHFFVAKYDQSQKVNEGGGLASEQEDIEVLEFVFEDAYSMIEAGKIVDAKTIMLLQYARINLFA